MSKYDIDRLDNRDPARLKFVVDFINQYLTRYFRSSVNGLERVPEGAGLYVGNHNAGPMVTDLWLFGAAVHKELGIEYVPYGLGHEVVLQWPLVNDLVVPLGGVRASHENAERLFSAGKKVLVYPGGDVEALRPFRKRTQIVFSGRRGYIRLALKNNVPIIPVVSSGAHSSFVVIDDMKWLARALRMDRMFRFKAFPLTFSLPWGFTLGVVPPYLPLPSRISIEVMNPIYFERSGDVAANDDVYVRRCADYVEASMQKTMHRLERQRQQLKR